MEIQMLSKLKKLKGRSLAEVKDRGRQSANVWAERLHLSRQARMPSDAEFFAKMSLPEAAKNACGLLDYYRQSPVGGFYPSFDEPAETIRIYKDRFPDEARAVVDRADRILDGLFDLLGYENLWFQRTIPDWHFDPINGRRSPKLHWSQIELENPAETGDKKIIWELNRHQYFSTLGRAYWLTGDEKYAEMLVAHWESWFDETPPKTGVNWLSSLELAFRAISWIWAFHFVKNSPSLTPEIFLKLLKNLYLHGRHLETYLSTYFSPNTHLTGEALGLYFLGLFLPELEDAARWKRSGYRIMLDALDFQIRKDGVYCEQSSHYHRYTTDFYANLLILRQREGLPIDAKHRTKTAQLFDFLLAITQPNGETPLIGDDDGGRLYFLDERPINDFRPTLAIGATLLTRGDLKFVAGKPTAELLWLLGPEGLRTFDELTTILPKKQSQSFPESGFFVLRDTWKRGANYVLVDCGPHGFLNGGHAHADALSFVLSFASQPVFVDSGTYNYTSDLEARRLFRSSSAHNCLTVNGESSSEPNTAFSWRSTASGVLLGWSDGAEQIRFRGRHDGFARFGIQYVREIALHQDKTVTIDDIIESEKDNSFALNFILSPQMKARVVDAKTIEIGWRPDPKGLSLSLATEVAASGRFDGGAWRVEPFYVSTCYGAKTSTVKSIFEIRGQGKLNIRNILRKAVR